MARVLVVATREPDAPGALNGLAGKALTFLNDAQSYDGACRNRMNSAGRWTDRADHRMTTGVGCIWGLGTAAAHSDVSLVRRLAVIQFERAAKARSPWPRAMAFAAIGAAELLTVEPGHAAALQTPHRLRRHRCSARPTAPNGLGQNRDSPTPMRCSPRR